MELTVDRLLVATMLLVAACGNPTSEPLVVVDTAAAPSPEPTASSPTDGAPGTVGEAGVDVIQPLSQIDTVDGEWWIDGFGGLDAGRTYVSLGRPVERTRGESDRCPGAEWIDERDAAEGVIQFAHGGTLATSYRIFAAFETDNLIAKPACMFIEGNYDGRDGDVAGTSGTYTIEWGTRTTEQSLVFDGG